MEKRCKQIFHKALAVLRPQFRLHFEGGIRRLQHWSRMWFHGRALAASHDVDPAVLAWFAYLHDNQRFNDARDPAHGSRAADFAVRLRRERVIDKLNDRAFGCLCEAMRLHSDGHTTGDLTVLAFWDSDHLNLARVGIRPLRDRLCTPQARHGPTIDGAVRMAEGLSRSASLNPRRVRDEPPQALGYFQGQH